MSDQSGNRHPKYPNSKNIPGAPTFLFLIEITKEKFLIEIKKKKHLFKTEWSSRTDVNRINFVNYFLI